MFGISGISKLATLIGLMLTTVAIYLISYHSAYAQKKWTKISNNEAVVIFLASDLEDRYKSTWKLPDPAYTYNINQGVQWREGNGFFKAILMYGDLAGDMIYEAKWRFERVLSFKQFRGASIAFGRMQSTRNALGRVEYKLFEFQDRGCLALRSYWGTSPHLGTHEGTSGLVGYYCTAKGQRLSDSSAREVVKAIGIESVARPEGRYMAPAVSSSSRDSAAAPPAYAKPMTKTGTISTNSVPIAINWEGLGDLLLGRLTYSNQQGEGEIHVSVPGTECKGSWKYASGKYGTPSPPEGVWSLTCSNGKAASGTYVSDAPNQGTGSGKDAAGNRIRVTYGER